jgi:hypothetical protein
MQVFQSGSQKLFGSRLFTCMAGDPQPLSCPRCGGAMRVVLVVPAVARHPELTSYACRVCGEVLTTADDEDGASAPD